MIWTPKEVRRWLRLAVDVLERLPDREMRYLRNAKRSRFPDVVETWLSSYQRAVDTYQLEGKAPETKVRAGRPEHDEIDMMETVMLGEAYRRLGMPAGKPWLNYLEKPRRKLMMDWLDGKPWHSVAAIYNRSERTCRRWRDEGLKHIADELTTLMWDG